MRNTTQSIGTYLLDSLQKIGVQHIFGVPGDYVLRFNKLIEQHTIQFVNATRENTAGYMADAYARLRGVGAVCVTYGVGINITNAISQAYVESSPVILISGAPATDQPSRHLHHMLPNTVLADKNTQLEIFRKITVAQAVLDNAQTAASEIDRVLEACLTQKKPVYIELPKNFVAAPLPKHAPHIIEEPCSDPKALEELIEEVHRCLKNSKQPVLWIGHEIARYGVGSSLIAFAEKNNIPIVTSLLGKTAINEHHPLFVGVYQGAVSRPEVQKFVENCDLHLIFGVLFSDMDTGLFTAKMKPQKSIIASAEKVSIGKHFYVDIAFPEFIDTLSKLTVGKRFKNVFPKHKQKPFSASKRKISSTRLFECIQKHLKPEHLVVTDIGDALFGSTDFILEQNSYLAGAYFGSLGFAVPGAVGASIAMPQKRVICIVGDGAFQMTCGELSTAVRYHLDPIVILLNNHGYGTERPLLEGNYNDIVNWNYSAIPLVLGQGIGFLTKTEQEFEQAFLESLAQRDCFTIIEVELGKLDFSPTMERFVNIAKRK